MDLGQYWQELIVFGTPILGIMIAGGIKWIKNKLATTIIGSTALKVKEELGADEYKALVSLVKDYGIQKIVPEISKLVNDFKEVKEIVPLIIAMSQTHLEMGVYDELPAIKEIVEKTLGNVE
jgi:hypothetical protein